MARRPSLRRQVGHDAADRGLSRPPLPVTISTRACEKSVVGLKAAPLERRSRKMRRLARKGHGLGPRARLSSPVGEHCLLSRSLLRSTFGIERTRVTALPAPEDWQAGAACRGQSAVIFFAPTHFERKEARARPRTTGQGRLRLLPGAQGVPQFRPADPGAARHLGRLERDRAPRHYRLSSFAATLGISPRLVAC